MFQIKECDNSALDKEELVRYHTEKRRNETGREMIDGEIAKITQFIDSVLKSFITRNFLAYESEELVGWLGIREVVPPTMNFYEYHPIIFSEEKKVLIAQQLIQSSIEFAKKKNIANVRVFTDATEEREDTYNEIKQYFLQSGMNQTHTVLCMENKLTTDNLMGVSVESPYYVETLDLQDKQKLLDCYFKIFAESADNFTRSLDEEENKYWNFTIDAKYDVDSRVIKKDDEIVAMIRSLDYGNFMELGPIGVIPDHRGNGLGRVLMEECLSSLINRDKTDCYLEVDITNTPAINLYKKYGFAEVSKKHGFLWRAADQKR